MPPTKTQFDIRTREGRFDLEATVLEIGPDILVAGASPSLDARAILFPGHREDQLAKPMADRIAQVTGRRTVVTAGAHWDRIDREGIAEVLKNGERLADLILERLASPGNR